MIYLFLDLFIYKAVHISSYFILLVSNYKNIYYKLFICLLLDFVILNTSGLITIYIMLFSYLFRNINNYYLKNILNYFLFLLIIYLIYGLNVYSNLFNSFMIYLIFIFLIRYHNIKL